MTREFFDEIIWPRMFNIILPRLEYGTALGRYPTLAILYYHILQSHLIEYKDKDTEWCKNNWFV